MRLANLLLTSRNAANQIPVCLLCLFKDLLGSVPGSGLSHFEWKQASNASQSCMWLFQTKVGKKGIRNCEGREWMTVVKIQQQQQQHMLISIICKNGHLIYFFKKIAFSNLLGLPILKLGPWLGTRVTQVTLCAEYEQVPRICPRNFRHCSLFCWRQMGGSKYWITGLGKEDEPSSQPTHLVQKVRFCWLGKTSLLVLIYIYSY